MSLRKTSAGFALALLTLTFTGTCLADNCDQRCRNRQQFWKCNGALPGYFFRYTLPDCYYCTNGRCDTAAEGSDRDCIQSGQNSRQTRPTGLANCNCGTFVEAAALTPNNDEDGYTFENKHVCDTTPLPVPVTK